MKFYLIAEINGKGRSSLMLEQPQHGEGIQPDKDYGDGKKVVMELVRITDT